MPGVLIGGKVVPGDIQGAGKSAKVVSFIEYWAYTFSIEFVCRMYGDQQADDVNEARLNIFRKTFQFKDVNEPFSSKFKNIDAANLPPCKTELHQQLHRANYISSVWGNANLKIPTQLTPLDYGWTEIVLFWFEWNQSAAYVNDVIIQPDTGEEINVTDDDDDSEEDEYE